MARPIWYRLDGQTPVPCSMEEWAFDRTPRLVGKTQVGPYRVSTVFLGQDCGNGDGPELFETMVFVASPDGWTDTEDWPTWQRRYATWRGAVRGPAHAVRDMAEVVATFSVPTSSATASRATEARTS